MSKIEIKSNGDLYDAIINELDRVGGMLNVVECLAAGEYEGADNCIETLLQSDRNGFMCMPTDTMQRLEQARQLIREMHERMSAETVTA